MVDLDEIAKRLIAPSPGVPLPKSYREIFERALRRGHMEAHNGN